MSNTDDVIDLNDASLNKADDAPISQDEATAVRAINGAPVDTVTQPAAPQEPPRPFLQLASGLREDGFVIALAPRQEGEVPLVASIVYQNVSLAVAELEAALNAARQAELTVQTHHAYNRGRQDALTENVSTQKVEPDTSN